MISTRTHGILDYLVGGLMVLAPRLFGFANSGAASGIFLVLGAGAIAYSLFTDYELGLVRMIPFGGHLVLDFASGLLLALSPWLFGFADRITTPHVIFGLIEIGAASITRRVPAMSIEP